MAISFVAVTAPTVTATASLVVNKPAGVVAGDAMLMQVMIPGAFPSCALPDGWLEVPLAYTGPTPRVLVLWKIAGASEPSSYTLTFPTSDTVAAGIIAFHSDIAADIYPEVAASNFGSSPYATLNTRVWPTVQVTSAAAMLVFFGTFAANTGSTPVGATERWDAGSTRQYCMTAAFSGPGTTPAVSATTVVEVDYRNVTVALVEGANVPFPGPQYVAAASAIGTVTASQSLTIPSSVEVGDMLIAQISFSSDRTPTLPAGWTELSDIRIAVNFGLRVYWKIAESGDIGATLTVTFAAGFVGCALGLTACRSLRGQDLALEVVDSQSNGTTATFAYPAVTTAYDNALLLYLAAFPANSNITAPFDGISRYRPGVSGMGINSITKLTFAAGTYSGFTSVATAGTGSRTATIVVVELEQFAPGLDASLTTFLQVQAARQSAFDVPALPAFALPVVFEYADGDQDQIAQWDAGVWTGLEIVEQVAKYATFKLRGVLFFELMPLLLAAGFAPMTPSGTGPYAYEDSVAPGASGVPAPYTFRFGGNDGNRSPTSMVQVQDAYLSKLTLTYNVNVRVVQTESEWFGRFVDDNDGLGYEPEAVTLPDGLRMVNGLAATLGFQDAGSTGGAFDAITELACDLIEWTLTLDTGLRPAWCGDGNNLSYGGVYQEWPSISFAPTIRSNIDTYALVMTKAQQRQFQELQLTFYDAFGGDRSLVLRMTGRWQPKLNAHERVRGEVVMKPIFEVRTPATQTTTPHWLSYEVVTGWQHE